MQPTSLSNLIITRILRDQMVTLSELEARASERGLLLSDLYAALAVVHRDKRIRRSVSKGEVVYCKAPPKAEPPDHQGWVRRNYPPMDATNDGSGFDVDYSYLFLSPDALLEYKAAAKNMPKHMIQFKHDTTNTRRLPGAAQDPG
jgi:hypothetical protein